MEFLIREKEIHYQTNDKNFGYCKKFCVNEIFVKSISSFAG